jgi:hypothetical protein
VRVPRTKPAQAGAGMSDSEPRIARREPQKNSSTFKSAAVFFVCEAARPNKLKMKN